MISSKTDRSSETESKRKCKKSSLVGVSGSKLARLWTSKLLPELCSLTFKRNSEKRVDKILRKFRVKLTTPLGKMSLLERQNTRELDKRLVLKNKFSNLNRGLKFPNKRLKITLKSLSLKRLEKSLWRTKGWLSRSKRV